MSALEVKRYRVGRDEVEAIQYDGSDESRERLAEFAKGSRHGIGWVNPKDYCVRGANGGFYTVSPIAFEKDHTEVRAA